VMDGSKICRVQAEQGRQEIRTLQKAHGYRLLYTGVQLPVLHFHLQHIQAEQPKILQEVVKTSHEMGSLHTYLHSCCNDPIRNDGRA
jgi:hypothetical protein